MHKKRKKQKKVSIHDKTIDWLVDRLMLKERYTSIKTKVTYNKGKLQGEVDVLTFCKKNNLYHFYEVKGSYSDGTYKKALKQFKRYCKAHPDRKVKGIFVSLTNIFRLKNATKTSSTYQ